MMKEEELGMSGASNAFCCLLWTLQATTCNVDSCDCAAICVQSNSTSFDTPRQRRSSPPCLAPVELGLCDESVDDHAVAKRRRLLLLVPYQRGDSDVPQALSNLQCSCAIKAILIFLEVDVAARSKELLRDGHLPFYRRVVERSGPILLLNIDVTASFNDCFVISCRVVERRDAVYACCCLRGLAKLLPRHSFAAP
jgi:hypothetical protein